ncbi:hypothetical protein HNV28_35430 [Myxococcus xanthus]|uniref:ZIP family metal transporter n=2 Tax=Myxococcus xanthus TaxID=34 RepID=A0A7Y4IQN1_MYXXA|nr:hypothetical protein [Myxococcus xanthus]NOJ83543.1 hypothetical protein [Myxococcus xanthus]NOJ87828.1 hypothetical protein [Myxococcus xanthus]
MGAGLVASLLAGTATGLGALPVLVTSELSRKAQDRMLGFNAGVMLAATSFSLVIPSMMEAVPARVARPEAARTCAQGASASRAAFLALLAGLVEPVGALFGLLALSLSSALLPWGLAFAGGAMRDVISHEMIPESHRGGFEREATTGLMWGFVLALVLDMSLG